MEITHKTYNLRIAPRKLRLVADKIRYQNAEQAAASLQLVPNKGGHLIAKALKSAVQVAKDKNLDPSTLIIQRVWCDEGPAMKRLVGASRGRMTRIMKKHSHLSLVLAGSEAARSRKKAKVADEPAADSQPNQEKE